MSNPRICIAIATFYPIPGGAETQAFAQARSLLQRGYTADIITFRHERAWLPYEVMEGVPVIRVAGMFLGGREKLPRIFQRLLYLVALGVMAWTLWRRRHHYDVLHVYQLNSFTLPTAFVSRLTHKPMMISVRSIGPTATAGSLPGSSSSKVSLVAGPLDPGTSWLWFDGYNWMRGDLERLERLGKLAVRLARAWLYQSRTVIVVLSSRIKGYLTCHGFDLPDMQLIPNGVDITHLRPKRTGDINNECMQVICVSRLSYEKGIDVLLQAWRLVYQQMPQARLIIVGDGPLQPQLECMAQALGIADTVEFTGLQRDILAQLQRAGLAVLPSRREGMPNAVLEAMACGLPCVSTRVSGSEDIIQDGVNGLLVESEDYQAMAAALLTLLRDPVLIQEYGKAARETVEKHYAFDLIMDRYIELYSDMAERRSFAKAGKTHSRHRLQRKPGN